ncbi:hypothetical protein BGW36DRAFT_59550 [Talaromyces proteolyticus]|uniref:Uncharacterized protein n=1 Tax=Talaromyces proteolyticus TaxID=1131652 RepID=A0AAD4PTG8_9EURO|nr:uncharacterized protein BGW36DRAFT_59550 [Talaromyces proteolyticus]KAH8690771.1 hypothetical protein BGW36DRAFT_59550 [Talaromyces proteolyticus]
MKDNELRVPLDRNSKATGSNQAIPPPERMVDAGKGEVYIGQSRIELHKNRVEEAVLKQLGYPYFEDGEFFIISKPPWEEVRKEVLKLSPALRHKLKFTLARAQARITQSSQSPLPDIPAVSANSSRVLSVKRTISEDCTQNHGNEPPLKLLCLEIESRRRTGLRVDHLIRGSRASAR